MPTPCLRAATITPTPSGLVRTNASPARPPAFVTTCRANDGLAAAQDLTKDVQPQALKREGHEVQGAQRLSAHRIDVRERVGCRDSTEVKRIVDDGSEEVDGLDQRQVAAELHDRRVIAGLRAHEHAWVQRPRQRTHQRQQAARRQLASAAGARAEGREWFGGRRHAAQPTSRCGVCPRGARGCLATQCQRLAGIVVELSDADIRAQVAAAPVLEFPEPAYTAARPLAKATIAIVTTAGIHRRGDEMFSGMGDQSFRVIDASERDLLSSHMSPNFDLSGFAADLNVVYPIDRLRELQAEGVVGALSPVNLSFMGAQGWSPTMETIVLDTGPAAAQRLLSAGVDTVLLTPV